MLRELIKVHEYEDISDPDEVAQGDVIEWLPSHAKAPWRVFGVVVTADCDLAWGKHEGIISYVPGLLSSDFIWQGFRGKFFTSRHAEALQSAAKLANLSRRKMGIADSNISTSAMHDWLKRAGREGVLNELNVADAPREKIRTLLDQILAYDEVLDQPNADMSLLTRAFAMTGVKGDQAALIKRIEESWGQLPGDIFHLPSLPTGDEEGMFLMLRHIRQLPASAIAGRPGDIDGGNAKVKRVARVCPPYRYSITQNLARVFADIGLPEEHDARRKSSAQRFFDTRK